jgi:hypothetical protein
MFDCKLVSQYKFTLAFSIKLGHMAFSLKNHQKRLHDSTFNVYETTTDTGVIACSSD